LVLECTHKGRLAKDFAEEVRRIWERWLAEAAPLGYPKDAEDQRKEQLLSLRTTYQERLSSDVMAQIMRAEAAKYNKIRS